MRTAVVDSSVLINLAHLNLVAELSLFFDRVYVPRAVHKEVSVKGRARYRLVKFYRTSVLQRCSAANKTNVELLRAELDPGEAEALIQAQENNVLYFVGDDKRAREVAENMGRQTVGTLKILARLELESRVPNFSRAVDKLRRDLRFRVSDNLVREAVEKAWEPI